MAVHTIISNNNDAFSFSIPEGMDYSIPFDFLTSIEDSSIDLNNFPNDNKSIDPKINYTYSFAGKVDSDMLLEGENEGLKNKDHNDYEYDKDLKNDNDLSKLIETESGNTTNSANSQMDLYENKYQEKNEEIKSNENMKSSKIESGDGKMVLINFDDNWKSQYENAK